MTDINPHKHNGEGSPSRPATLELEAGLADDDALDDQANWKWETDPSNPYNWPTKWKVQQVLMIASAAFTTWEKPPL